MLRQPAYLPEKRYQTFMAQAVQEKEYKMARKKSKSRYVVPELGRSVNRRPARVADAIRNELAMLFLRGVKDPRVAGVSISRVEVTADLRSAFIYFSCEESEKQKSEEGLASAQGFIRSYLAKNLSLRHVPKLVFEYDLSLVRQIEMDQILREIESERQSSQ